MNPLAEHVPSNTCTKCTATNYNAVSSLLCTLYLQNYGLVNQGKNV